MKSAQISDILDIWCNIYNTTWYESEKRSGDKDDECLIGESELQYSYFQQIENIQHILIDFNNNSQNVFNKPITSFNSEKLTKDEIIDLIKSKNKNL